MRSKNHLAAIAVAALLICAIPTSTAAATSSSQSSISALKGVDATPLSADEMRAITGQLNAYDISAGLFALASKLDAYPKLKAATLKLAQYYYDNASAVNAFFMRLGIFTPCTTGCP